MHSLEDIVRRITDGQVDAAIIHSLPLPEEVCLVKSLVLMASDPHSSWSTSDLSAGDRRWASGFRPVTKYAVNSRRSNNRFDFCASASRRRYRSRPRSASLLIFDREHLRYSAASLVLIQGDTGRSASCLARSSSRERIKAISWS